ncbi:DUF3363 domain-containing protein, partial [Salmonella enterica subsp. enterica serovar Corvallis]|nr:DUF3363 domain-containing protein [Salmonella enterica subsp. enterica serovar Corvallis]
HARHFRTIGFHCKAGRPGTEAQSQPNPLPRGVRTQQSAPGVGHAGKTGQGQQVREAMDQRREHHIEQGDATRSRDSRVFYRRNLLAILREREVAGVGSDMALSKGLPFRAATDGESVSGKFTGTVHLSSGKFAVVEKSHEFTLVPWRPSIDRQLGREVMGIVQGGSVSWQLGRQRGLER